MSEEERLKSAVASRGNEEPDPRAEAWSDQREEPERRSGPAPGRESDLQQKEQQAAGGPLLRWLWKRVQQWVQGTEQQPGGGHWSESERPDSPESRWGGGR